MNAGGVIPGTMAITLADDECILRRDGLCLRDDARHNCEAVEIYSHGDSEPLRVHTRCLHRPCHVVPVESGGELVARLCRACDAQLAP